MRSFPAMVAPEQLGEDVVLYREDARIVLARLAPSSVDAVVTSPPYADARDDDYESAPADEFLAWIAPFLRGIHPVLRDTGGLMLNLGRKFKDGRESSYAERTLLLAEEIGFQRIDTIVWGKINGRPINPYLTNKHESVYWLTTGDPLVAYRGYDEVRYPYSVETLARYQRRWTNHANRKERGSARNEAVQEGRTAHADGARPGSLYVTQVGKEKGIKHPSPMALDLARFLVCLACPRGGTILDPFAGSGTTGLASRLHGRKAVLIEQDDEYADEASRRLLQQALAV